MAEQLVAVTRLRAAPLDMQPLARSHIGAVAALLEIGEEARHGHVQRTRERLQRRERRRRAAVLDLRQHAGRELRFGGKFGRGELQTLAEQPDARRLALARALSAFEDSRVSILSRLRYQIGNKLTR